MGERLKSRLHDYEQGWRQMLIDMGIATRRDVDEAINRVMEDEIKRVARREARRRRDARRRRREE